LAEGSGVTTKEGLGFQAAFPVHGGRTFSTPSEARRWTVSLAGSLIEIWDRSDVISIVRERLQSEQGPPLLIGSANLEHLYYFGRKGPQRDEVSFREPGIRWLVLLDGAPLVWRSRVIVGPKASAIAGSDVVGELLDVAADTRSRVGIMGGTEAMHAALRAALSRSKPELEITKTWAPSREDLLDPLRRTALAAEVRAAGIELLVVCLNKPTQEVFLTEQAVASNIRVGLAFGAALDFLSGKSRRAPFFLRRAGLEWLWRLVHEPRRLAERYLVRCPIALRELILDSAISAELPLDPREDERAAGLLYVDLTGGPEGVGVGAAAGSDRVREDLSWPVRTQER
jgi:N-acetylglucosaminyldiphosphoundecaprenol N-acetyl-beta-D-mannosaminyltransferase